MMKVENKDIFIDLKRNKSGVYLKVSEKKGSVRNTVLIPASGIERLKEILTEVSTASENITIKPPKATSSTSVQRSQRTDGNPEIAARSVYVTGLTWDTDEEELKEHFSQAGPVILATIIRQHRNGKGKASMGCGIVEFETIGAAENAIALMNETELKGRNIRVREDRIPEEKERSAGQAVERTSPDELDGEISPVKTSSRSRSSRKESAPKKIDLNDANIVPELCKVFITSLMPTITSDDLVEYFGTVGPVASAEILSTRKGRSICSGIVTFEDDSSVDDSIAQLSNIDFKGKVVVVRRYFV
eukprot:CAMPEP_0119034078 /NCGR_PEP_ID=MMETSP1177-20130426/1124_1 /TAXON_ID=2985 /ORGANISM="Ochromonas sp, Strain CCMP1899" /LENGTH=302 /DNA_ID=CAMNT_0006991293 /DNA_START=156 /DNA_END=1064 /DNA_ORIENTATION=+